MKYVLKDLKRERTEARDMPGFKQRNNSKMLLQDLAADSHYLKSSLAFGRKKIVKCCAEVEQKEGER